jgi:hypothetical protein
VVVSAEPDRADEADSDKTVVVSAMRPRVDEAESDTTVVVSAEPDRTDEAELDKTVVVSAKKPDRANEAESDKTVVVSAKRTAAHVADSGATVAMPVGNAGTRSSPVSADHTVILPAVAGGARRAVPNDHTVVLRATSGRTDVSSRDSESSGGLTRLIPAAPKDPPVFVDATGRRRRRLRRMAYALAAVGMAYTVLVGISFTGVTVSPETVIPFLDRNDAPAPTPGGGPPEKPKPTPAPSKASGTPESARTGQSPT